MATLSGALTFADLKNMYDDTNKRVANVIEVLKRTDEVYEDIPFLEANMVDGHKVIVRTGLPTGTYRRFNQGVTNTKATNAPITFPLSMLHANSAIDVDLANLGGDPNGARWNQSMGHLIGLGKQGIDTLFYADPVVNASTDDVKYPGLSYYYKANSSSTGENVISALGSGSDNSSIWIVAWGENAVYGVYPKGSQAGLQHRDLKEDWAEDVSGNRFRAYMDEYKWHMGLVIADWRCAVRICNIDVSDLGTASNRQALVELIIQGLNKIPSEHQNSARIYMNGTVRTALQLGIRDDVQSGGGLSFDNAAGKRIMLFDGVPVRRTDAILNTEATIS
jgi:hypothetical protein